MMPKKVPARKSKSHKKRPTDNKKQKVDNREFAAIICRGFLRRAEFIEALEKSNLVEYATEAFKTLHTDKASFLLHIGMNRQEWDDGIESAVKQFQDKLPETLYAAALITATQTSPFISRNFVKKNFIRGLVNWLFVESSEQKKLLVDGRGRKSKIETHEVYEAILKRGEDASRKGVAFDLGVSEKALNDWRLAQNHPTWKAAVKHVINASKKLTD